MQQTTQAETVTSAMKKIFLQTLLLYTELN